MAMSVIVEEVALEDLATMYEDNHEEVTKFVFQEVPFYSLKTGIDTQEETTIDLVQVRHLMECDAEVTTDIAHIAQEETSYSNDGYNDEEAKSPESNYSASNLSPHGRRKCSGTRRVQNPSTLQHLMEKHRHSERKRHHSLNEQLKNICQLIPGCNINSRETKVVMMQRMISYIAYLENSIKMLSYQIGSKPRPSWLLLTTNFASYFHDYFKGFDDADGCDEELLEASHNLSKIDEEEEAVTDSYSCGKSYGGSGYSRKVSSPTVDSTTTDSVVPVMAPLQDTAAGGALGGDQEVVVMSQDSGLAPSSHGDGEELWDACENKSIAWDKKMGTATVGASNQGEAEVFFRVSMDDGVSAMLEISSNTAEDSPQITGLGEDHKQEVGHMEMDSDRRVHHMENALTSGATTAKQISTLFSLQKHMPNPVQRRNKRKQLSPRRSASVDYLSDKAYLPSWSTVDISRSVEHQDRSPSKVQRTVPYNIRGNHRYPVQRLQATGAAAKLLINPLYIVKNLTQNSVQREPLVTVPEKENKLDLRKTSWMNGFMMFSRIHRRSYIEAHPGVHTSHISKIMGHAWRTMSNEEQAPYREKAQLCAKELFRVYTSQLSLPESSVSVTTSATTITTTTATAATATTTPLNCLFSAAKE